MISCYIWYSTTTTIIPLCKLFKSQNDTYTHINISRQLNLKSNTSPIPTDLFWLIWMVFFFLSESTMENPRMVYSLHLHYLKKMISSSSINIWLLLWHLSFYSHRLLSTYRHWFCFWFDFWSWKFNPLGILSSSYTTDNPQFRLTIEFDFGPNRVHWNWYFAIKNKKLIFHQNVISQTRFIKEYQLIVL